MNDENHGETKIIFGRDEINDFFVKSVNETEDNWDVLVYGVGASLFYYMIDLREAYQRALNEG